MLSSLISAAYTPRLCRGFSQKWFRVELIKIPRGIALGFIHFSCGVYWTKFECILSRILMSAPNLVRLGHTRGLAWAKPKNFPYPFPFFGGGSLQKKKGNFWFCFTASVSEKSTISLSLLVALFYDFAGDPRRSRIRVLWWLWPSQAHTNAFA